MGSSTSAPLSASEAGNADDAIEAQSRALDIQLFDQQLVDLFTFKILCLGAGESGKSTVVKQLKLIHKKPIEKDELDLIATSLHQNIVDCMKAISYAVQSFTLPPLSSDDAATEQTILSHDEHSRLPSNLATPILDLFNSSSYQTAYARRSEFWILDSFPYYLKHIERFLDPDFVPSEEDAVMARVRTTGIVESVLEQKIVKEEVDEPDSIAFRVVDVGGQRNERKKWMHCFCDVRAILFIVNLAGYNAVLFEDGAKNRLIEELELFEQVTNNPLFKDTPFFLFLNKKDLFETLISEFPLSRNFPDYTGPNSLTPALAFIENAFKQRLPAGKSVHITAVSARWKRDVKVAFDDVKKSLYDMNRKELLGQAGKINKQKKALMSKQPGGVGGASQPNTARGAQAETKVVVVDKRRSSGSEGGWLEGLKGDWKACWSGCWAEDNHLPEAKTVLVGGKKAQVHTSHSESV